jgi:hypothetical protein
MPFFLQNVFVFSTSYARLKKWEHLQNIQQLTVTRNDFGHVDEWK